MQMNKKDFRMRAVVDLLNTIPTEDSAREGLKGTPDRVARMYEEIFAGYEQDAVEILKKATFSDDEHQELVIVKDIPFYSHCEHHMVPFFGKVIIAYIPNGTVAGLSKFARVVEVFARRLQIQERLTSQIADIIEEVLSPLGVMVIIEAEHLCMTMRGVQKPGTTTVTSALRGVMKYNENPARLECLGLLNARR